jgi:cobalamin biosynthetic protein CobC
VPGRSEIWPAGGSLRRAGMDTLGFVSGRHRGGLCICGRLVSRMENLSAHGGRLENAARLWPAAPKPWIDLSTGINPSAYPAPRASRSARSRLPFPEEISELESVAGAAFGVTDPASVVAVGGAEVGLRLLPRLLRANTVFIESPTYMGHADAWAQAGARVVNQTRSAECVVIVNPNNPDGRTHDRDALLAIADRQHERGGWLVVDESFAEVLDEPSIAAAGHPAIIALRSFGKFYGLAGLRLGFVLAPTDFAVCLRQCLGDWPISADAIAAGVAAYPDAAWRMRTRTRLTTRSEQLDRLLARAGLRVAGGTILFRLVEVDDAAVWFGRLAQAGILTRPFRYAPAWLRFGSPKSRDITRLGTALGIAP